MEGAFCMSGTKMICPSCGLEMIGGRYCPECRAELKAKDTLVPSEDFEDRIATKAAEKTIEYFKKMKAEDKNNEATAAAAAAAAAEQASQEARQETRERKKGFFGRD
jgi:methionyl-tRNA synthetase